MAGVDDGSACGWRHLTNHFPLEPPEIFRRSERDKCDGGRERERESGPLWAGRKQERGRSCVHGWASLMVVHGAIRCRD